VDAARSWIDRGLSARDRLLASPRFQRWAAGFPLTGWIARRRARALFDLCAGFVYSQVLYACVRLGVLEQLRDAPHTVAALAPRLALSADATARLLGAAVSLRLVERRQAGRYALGPLGAALVGNPGIAAIRSRCCGPSGATPRSRATGRTPARRSPTR
jgi:demethylspheroidene O-methyltransferase